MRVIRINRDRVSKRALAEAVAVLRGGGVVAYPTDTAYGLAADPMNAFAVRRVFVIKGREAGKPLPLIAATPVQAATLVTVPFSLGRLAKRHWPGPLTMVGPVRGRMAGILRAACGSRTAAIRVPASAWARAIAGRFGGPVTATSANRSGRPAPYSARAVIAEFRGRRAMPDLVLDAGPLPRRPVSTIVALRRGKMTVLREGAIRIR